MRHKIISKIADTQPYEIVKVELLADTQEEQNWIEDITEQTENYLTMNLEAVKLIEQNPPFFLIKKIKNNIGFGK